jgi:hypothetical protein
MTRFSDNATVEVDLIYQTASEKAFCFREDEKSSRDIWISKDQCSMLPTNPDRGDVVGVHMPEWLATKEGLI